MHSPQTARTAGLLYLAIIVLGLSGEIAVRQPLLAMTPEAVAARIGETAMLFRLSILADAAMVAADIALAHLLYRLLRPAGEALAAIAALFRLAQAAIIAGNLQNQYEALLWIDEGAGELAHHALTLHGAGYDLGLIFFGINSLLTGLLLIRATGFPAWLGGLMTAAGLTYLTGSTLRILAPAAAETFAPVYLIAILAETAFAITLLMHGRKGRMVGDERFELPTSSM